MSEEPIDIVVKKLYDVLTMPVWSRSHGREFAVGETIDLYPFDANPLVSRGFLAEHVFQSEDVLTDVVGDMAEAQEEVTITGITPVLDVNGDPEIDNRPIIDEPVKPRRKKE